MAKHAAPTEKAPLILRVFGLLMTLDGILSLFTFVLVGALAVFDYFYAREVLDEAAQLLNGTTQLTYILMIASVVLGVLAGVLLVKVGHDLRKNEKRKVAVWSKWLVGLEVINLALGYMIDGAGAMSISKGISIFLLVLLSVTIDPTLAAERRAERDQDLQEDMADAKVGMLGRDKTGKGYLRLDFFNLFWIFFVCCILGLILEIIWHMIVVDPGHYQDRAGLLIGPFSPIYGFGAMLITLALNRLYNKNIVLTFLVAGLVGASFEFATSWFMQNAFGVTAWDYSDYTILGYPDPIAVFCQGRTSTMFFCIWGILGLVWVKLILPVMLKGINVIPWKLRYSLTFVVAVLMLADGLLTLGSFDCWYQRSCGIDPTTPIEEFYAKEFPNSFMEHRFQSMTMNTDDATRADTADKLDTTVLASGPVVSRGAGEGAAA